MTSHSQVAPFNRTNVLTQNKAPPKKDQLDDFSILMNKRLQGKEVGGCLDIKSVGSFVQTHPHHLMEASIPLPNLLGTDGNIKRSGVIKFNSESSTPSHDQKI